MPRRKGIHGGYTVTIVRPYTGQDIEHIPGLLAKEAHLVGTVDQWAVVNKRSGAAAEQALLEAGLPQPPVDLSPVAGLPLRDYQKTAVTRVASGLRRDKGFILADDMGLGKTLQTLATWQALGRPYPLLIIAPASVRRGWVRECKKWLDVDATLVETGKAAREVGNTTKVVVTSYQLAAKELPIAFCPHMVVIDEAQNLRGRTAKRAERITELCHLATYRLALTGTPMWGRPRDLWQILKMLFRYRFGTANAFDFAYCGAYWNAFGGKENAGATRSDELRLRLGYVMLRRTKEDVAADLPPLTRQIRWLAADRKAKVAFEQSVLGKMRYIDAMKAALSAKRDAALEVCEEAGKFILFTYMKADAQSLFAALVESGIMCELITGDMTQRQREAAIDQAIKHGHSIVATIDACGVGVDRLQHVASNVVFHAIDPTPTKTAQAEARAHRIGQTSPVTVTYLALSDSVDNIIIERVVEKLEQWKGTMGNDSTAQMRAVVAAPATTQADMDDIAALFAEEA